MKLKARLPEISVRIRYKLVRPSTQYAEKKGNFRSPELQYEDLDDRQCLVANPTQYQKTAFNGSLIIIHC